MQPCWSFDEAALVDGNALKGRKIIIPTAVQDKALNQLYLNHIGIEKTSWHVSLPIRST